VRVPVEETFNVFVQEFGGELVCDLISQPNPPPNADYLFRDPLVIAELKCVEQDALTPEYNHKFQVLLQSWIQRDAIRLYGRTVVSLQQVPKQCQREWLQILLPPGKRILRDANTQIKETKRELALPSAHGLLLLVNEGNYSLQPTDVMYLIHRILSSKKQKDGPTIYSSIDWIIYFSVNMTVRVSAIKRDVNFWISASRETEDSLPRAFTERLRLGWTNYHARVTGREIEEIHLGMSELEGTKPVRSVQAGRFYTDSSGMKYKCVEIKGDLIRWMLLDCQRQGVSDVEFTQSTMFAGAYTPLTDSKEAERLEQRYRRLTAGDSPR
jgi:hypothetical protein